MPISNGPGLFALLAGVVLELHAVRARELTKRAAKISVESLAIVCLPSTGLPFLSCSRFMRVRLTTCNVRRFGARAIRVTRYRLSPISVGSEPPPGDVVLYRQAATCSPVHKARLRVVSGSPDRSL